MSSCVISLTDVNPIKRKGFSDLLYINGDAEIAGLDIAGLDISWRVCELEETCSTFDPRSLLRSRLDRRPRHSNAHTATVGLLKRSRQELESKKVLN